MILVGVASFPSPEQFAVLHAKAAAVQKLHLQAHDETPERRVRARVHQRALQIRRVEGPLEKLRPEDAEKVENNRELPVLTERGDLGGDHFGCRLAKEKFGVEFGGSSLAARRDLFDGHVVLVLVAVEILRMRLVLLVLDVLVLGVLVLGVLVLGVLVLGVLVLGVLVLGVLAVFLLLRRTAVILRGRFRILAESVDVLHLGEGGPGGYHAEVVVVVVVAVPDDARFVVAAIAIQDYGLHLPRCRDRVKLNPLSSKARAHLSQLSRAVGDVGLLAGVVDDEVRASGELGGRVGTHHPSLWNRVGETQRV